MFELLLAIIDAKTCTVYSFLQPFLSALYINVHTDGFYTFMFTDRA